MNNKKFSRSLLGLAVALSVNTAVAADAYRLVEIKTDSQYKESVPKGINSSGEIVGNAFDRYNVPLFDESYLTDFGIPQEEIDANEYSAVSLTVAKAFLLLGSGTLQTNPEYQKISDRSAFTANLAGVEDDQGNSIVLTDVIDEVQGVLTGSTESRLSAINDNGMMVGYASAPFISSTNLKTVLDTDTEDETDTKDVEVKIWNREYSSRATVTVNGETTTIAPSFDTYGGRSVALDVSNSGYVAGTQTVSFLNGDDTQTSIDTSCASFSYVDNEALCGALYQNANLTYLDTAVIWQVDSTGNVIDTMTFPLDFELTDTTTGTYSSAVNAVNNSGQGVGVGRVPRETDDRFVAERAMIFSNGEMTRVPIEHEEFDASLATDINDNGVVVGNHRHYVSGNDLSSKYFIYNTQTNTLEYPATFFASAESSAAAINNNGVVVGTAEYELTLATNKRSHGFVYDSLTQTFNDLNEVVACGSGLEIVSAQDINDEGQILATALKIQQATDPKGELLFQQTVEYELDANGDIIEDTATVVDVLDENGERVPATEVVVVPVRLDPVDSIAQGTCEVEEPTKRQGLSLGWLGTIFLAGLVGIRRRFL